MELTNWLLVVITFIGLILTVVVPMVAYFNSAINKNRQEISEHKTHVAETYAKEDRVKEDMKQLGDRMERQLQAGFENIKQLINSIRNKDAA